MRSIPGQLFALVCTAVSFHFYGISPLTLVLFKRWSMPSASILKVLSGTATLLIHPGTGMLYGPPQSMSDVCYRYIHHLVSWDSLAEKAPAWARRHQASLFTLIL